MIEFKNLNELFKMGEEILGEALTDFSKSIAKMDKSLLANITKSETEFKIEILLPGTKKENVSITLEKNILTIETKTSEVDEQNYSQIRWIKFDNGSIKLKLPENGFNAESITSELKDGILTILVSVKQPEVAPAKTINVN